ncbi:hypothetical protein Ancab_013359, partial [Ancistrocladus abbreviatus]
GKLGPLENHHTHSSSALLERQRRAGQRGEIETSRKWDKEERQRRAASGTERRDKDERDKAERE